VNRFTPGNRLRLLRSGAEYFPALVAAIDAARTEVYLECYIFAEDAAGLAVAGALGRAAARGVAVHLLVDGWGVKAFLRDRFVDDLRASGVRFAKYRPETASSARSTRASPSSAAST
jgi:cardiolipin synthase